MEYAEDLRDATTNFGCALTGCSGSGMGLVGWFLPLTPLLYGLAMAQWFQRAGSLGRWALIGLGVALFVVAMQFIPGKGGPDLADLFRQPGGPALAEGMIWGYGTLVLALVTLGVVGAIAGRTPTTKPEETPVGPVVHRRAFKGAQSYPIAPGPFRGHAPAIATLIVIVFGGLAAATATVGRSGFLLADQIFPETQVRVQSITYTRESSTSLDGCAEKLSGCLRTAEFDFTTSDSDARINFRVISFPDNDAAWDAWQDLRDPRDPAALREKNVTGEFFTVATVRHADGRPIETADEKWLRWSADQLEYAFRRAIDYSLLTEPKPSETSAPRS
jgi:hypothetical protein